MAPAITLDGLAFAILDARNRTAYHQGASGPPIPAATCYAVPYGATGFFNHIITLVFYCCLMGGRTPLWPWRTIKHPKLSSYILGFWVCLLLSLNISNLIGCTGKDAPQSSSLVRSALWMIILGKMISTAFWGVILIPCAWKAAEKKDAVVDESNEEGGPATNGQVGGHEGTDSAQTEETSTTEELGPDVPAQASRSSEDDDQLHKTNLSTQTENPPPPAYNAIFPSDDHPSDPLLGNSAADPKFPNSFSPVLFTIEPSLGAPSSSRDAGTQTTPISLPSPVEATEVDSTSTTETAKSPEAPKFPDYVDDIPSVVMWFINFTLVLAVLTGIIILSVVNFRTGNPRAINSTFLLGLVLLMFGLPTVCVALYQVWRDWRKRPAREGGYQELSGEEGEIRGCELVPLPADIGTDEAGERAEVQELSGAVVDEDDAHNEADGVGAEEPAGSPSQASSPAASTAVEKPPAKSKIRLPFILLPGGVFFAIATMWCADWVVAAATGNTGGVPTLNVHKGQWIAYLVISKLPLLCF